MVRVSSTLFSRGYATVHIRDARCRWWMKPAEDRSEEEGPALAKRALLRRGQCLEPRPHRSWYPALAIRQLPRRRRALMATDVTQIWPDGQHGPAWIDGEELVLDGMRERDYEVVALAKEAE